MSGEILGRYVEVGGSKIYYESAGEGSPMLCIHTAGRDCRQWHAWMEYFLGSHMVVALDVPGHAKSWPLPGNHVLSDPEELVDFFWQFKQALGLGPVILAGTSMGGNFVLRLAQKYPAEVVAVISMEGSDCSPTISAGNLELMTHPQVNFTSYSRGQSMGLIGRRTSQPRREFLIWNTLQAQAETTQADLTAYTAFDCRAEMDKISCPVLMIRGEDDWLVSQSMVEAAASRLRTGELVTIPGGGHFIHAELPEDVCPLVEDFLRRRLG